MTEIKEYKLLNDKYAKQIFNTKDNIDYVIRFVSKVLNIPENVLVSDFELLPTNILSNEETKDSEVDALYEHNNMYINIEINTSPKEEYKKKNFSYCAQLILKKVKPNEKYRFNKIQQININTFDYFKEDKLIYKSTIREETNNKLRNDYITIYDINIDYLWKMSYNEIKKKDKGSLEYLLYFLICENKKERDELYRSDEIMEKLEETIDKLSKNLDAYLYYNKEKLDKLAEENEPGYQYEFGLEEGLKQGRIEGKEEGLKQGKKEGISQRNVEIAKSMLEENLDINLIIKLTGLTKEEIDNLKNVY